MSKTLRLIAADEVAKNASSSSCWVSFKGRVYDVSSFLEDHPGGDDLIMRYAGKDIGSAMDDPDEHSHSDSAYELLDEFLIGRLASAASPEESAAVAPAAEGGANFTGKDDGIVITEDFHPDETSQTEDYKKHAFLDLTKPLIPQMMFATFSKDFYLAQVHSPRHLKEPARLFGQWYLEMFTRTPWYVVPAFWGPIAAALYYRSVVQFVDPAGAGAQPLFAFDKNSHHLVSSPFTFASANLDAGAMQVAALTKTLPLWGVGIVIWTMLEYLLHRFLFHVDDMLPDKPVFLLLHFLLHGIHHYLPMDRLRLVMPPLLFAVLQAPFTWLAHRLFPAAVANGIIAGAFTMYIGYDCMHYALHHSRLPAYLRKMKKYHLEHHYKNYELGFGVTSKFWDVIFGTLL
ncbi:fatty acid alpha-hydroxylase [Tilletia horrida]|uniref:Fatty acid alpha-hydroxylase n=1 Tax=Tilletia horrida TaxID=155126 RepID=A0AAN6JNJ0_9BASI|nr:fatty acid alpha-hydroxylase [Tilletia horrida]KAK0538520.1 fatty acid alpha-hydroxylase [Tilletia horrida]KAK0540744.1 fatty acid alpha-hydroxylase [Tilletia horrida]